MLLLLSLVVFFLSQIQTIAKERKTTKNEVEKAQNYFSLIFIGWKKLLFLYTNPLFVWMFAHFPSFLFIQTFLCISYSSFELIHIENKTEIVVLYWITNEIECVECFAVGCVTAPRYLSVVFFFYRQTNILPSVSSWLVHFCWIFVNGNLIWNNSVKI